MSLYASTSLAPINLHLFNSMHATTLVSRVRRTCAVQEVPGKSLEQYLSLPVEDYNSLDPKVVEFLGDNRFRLTPPFQEWFRINLYPEIILRIQPLSLIHI